MLSTNPTTAGQDLVSKLERRVVAAARAALARQRLVCPLDVLIGIGWLPAGLVTGWRRGRVDHLEAVAAVPPQRLATALAAFHRFTRSAHLTPNEVAYLAATRDHRPLRFTADGDPAATPPPAAAAGSGAAPPLVPWTPTRSPTPSSPRYATTTPATTRCSCPASPAPRPADRSGPTSTMFSTSGAAAARGAALDEP